MSKYIIFGLRGVVIICEKENKNFIGNHDYKLFDTKKEAREFMKSSDFKVLDMICPCEWHIQKVEEAK